MQRIKLSGKKLLRKLTECLPATSDKEGIKGWIIILLAAVFGLNMVAAGFYAVQKKPVDYFDSKSYEALLAALLIPLLLSFIANVFKINEKIEAEQEKQTNEKKENDRLQRLEIRKKQIEAIEKTNAMWSNLYQLSTEVAYFKAGHGKASVREIRKKLECFTNAAEEVVNLWHLNFSDVALEVATLALPGLNLLLLSALTVADVVESEEKEDKAEAKHLQNCLLVIQDGVRSGLHYSLMQIFYFAMENKPEDLKKQTAILRGWGELFQQLIKNIPPNLPSDADADSIMSRRKNLLMSRRKNYQAAFEQYTQAKKNCVRLEQKMNCAGDALKQIQDSAEFQAARTAYGQAADTMDLLFGKYERAISRFPPNGLGLSRKRFFSDHQIKNFTAKLFFQNDLINIQANV